MQTRPPADDVPSRILALEEWAALRERDIFVLTTGFSRMESEMARMASAFARGGSVTLPAIAGRPAPALPPRTPPPLPPRAGPPAVDSVILTDFPDIFNEFHESRFTLLWRGTRDGSSARDFHSRCDGHGNTLTLILDTDGNIFGGFTPVKWESRASDCWHPKANYKADSSLRSFLFSLKNPHNYAAKRFALKEERKEAAIECNTWWGPRFSDLCVSDNCFANSNSWAANFGWAYTNDTGLAGETFFTGSRNFTVKEIEVFEVGE
jgi:hypothetical protein